jgi:hypothetical protein
MRALALVLLLLVGCATTSSGQAGASDSEDPSDQAVERLGWADVGRRRLPIVEIARLGPAAAPKATRPLVEILGRGPADDRAAAAIALGWLEADAALPALDQALTDPDPRVVFGACRGLERFGARAAAARSRLVEASEHLAEPRVRDAALAAMLAIDGRPGPQRKLADDFELDRRFKYDCITGDGPPWQRWPSGERLERPVPGGRLYGINLGEFGGEVGFEGRWRSRKVLLKNVHPMAFTTLGSSLVVIADRTIYRLDQSSGAWRAEPFVELPGVRALRPRRDGGLEIDAVDTVVVVSPAGALTVTCRE